MSINPNVVYDTFGPSEEILIALERYEKNAEIKNFLREKRYSMKEIKDTASYRIVNHWCEKGLVGRETENNWLKLSIVDLVWIKIIAKLRMFGVSIEKMKLIKENLFFFASENKELTHFLDLFIFFTLQKRPMGIVILENGKAFLCHEHNLPQIKLRWFIRSYIWISLNEIVQSLFPKAQPYSFDIHLNYDSVSLSQKEKQLLSYLRRGEYEEIKVRLKDNQIELFEAKEKLKTTTRILEILKSSDYQDINIKVIGGEVINITRTEKRKI